MKKYFLALIFVCLLLSGCQKSLHGMNGVVEKAKEELSLSETDTLQLVDSMVIDDSALMWFISGNGDQAHLYFPMEFKIVGENEFKFEYQYKPMERGTDIVALEWKEGYSFLINHPQCKIIRITDDDGKILDIVNEKEKYPFVYYYDKFPREYVFLDANGNKLSE